LPAEPFLLFIGTQSSANSGDHLTLLLASLVALNRIKEVNEELKEVEFFWGHCYSSIHGCQDAVALSTEQPAMKLALGPRLLVNWCNQRRA